MFRPSQALLHQQKRSLLSIHHPLPLSNRDAHKLLGLLKTSFRKHLDSEHGPSKSPMEERLAKSTPPSTPHQGSRHTTQHFQSILTNPLIAQPQVIRGRSLPMDTFTKAVANGMMTLDSATTCLRMEEKRIKASTSVDVQERMKNSEAGLVVMKWVVSNGWAEDLSFLENENFTRIFMSFLVAEGLQDVVWTWIKRNLTLNLENIQAELCTNKWGSKSSRLPLLQLVMAEARNSACLDNAYLQLGKAYSLLQNIGFRQSAIDVLVLSAQKYLVDVTIHGRSIRPQASEDAYSTFLDTLPGKLVSSVGYEIRMAHLLLLHPTQSTVEPALEVFSSWDSLQTKGSQRPGSTSSERIGISATTRGINLAFDATKFLLDQERLSEADEVMNFLRNTFPKELGETRQKELDEAAAEASSLDFLDSLRLA